MSNHESLIEFCEKHGKFPNVPDLSEWLKLLEWEIVSNTNHSRSIRPYPVNLIRFSDEPGFYSVEDSLWPDIMYSPSNHPIPFVAANDKDAHRKLKILIDESYNSRYSEPIFAVGEIKDGSYGPQPPDQDEGVLRKMANNPSRAREFWEELMAPFY